MDEENTDFVDPVTSLKLWISYFLSIIFSSRDLGGLSDELYEALVYKIITVITTSLPTSAVQSKLGAIINQARLGIRLNLPPVITTNDWESGSHVVASQLLISNNNNLVQAKVNDIMDQMRNLNWDIITSDGHFTIEDLTVQFSRLQQLSRELEIENGFVTQIQRLSAAIGEYIEMEKFLRIICSRLPQFFPIASTEGRVWNTMLHKILL